MELLVGTKKFVGLQQPEAPLVGTAAPLQPSSSPPLAVPCWVASSAALPFAPAPHLSVPLHPPPPSHPPMHHPTRRSCSSMPSRAGAWGHAWPPCCPRRWGRARWGLWQPAAVLHAVRSTPSMPSQGLATGFFITGARLLPAQKSLLLRPVLLLGPQLASHAPCLVAAKCESRVELDQ